MENEYELRGNSEYQLRGNRVAILSLKEIKVIADAVCKATRLQKNKPVRFDIIFETLRYFGIEYDIVDDVDWLPFTSGCFNPTTGVISLPQSVFMGACDNNYEDLHIGFHEIGHALLVHKPLMHYSLLPAVKEEDAEWQADTFADLILKKIGMERSLQLDLFYKDKA